VGGHHGLEILQTFDGDPLQQAFGGQGQQFTELDQEQAEMLEGSPGQAAAVGLATPGKRQPKIVQGQTPATGENAEGDITQPPAQRFREQRGQSADDPGEQRQDGLARLRRCCRNSTPIGMHDSTMTTMTITWMWRSMFGTARPSKYPAHVMLTTQPIPPKAL
jgi:hypothetical protein